MSEASHTSLSCIIACSSIFQATTDVLSFESNAVLIFSPLSCSIPLVLFSVSLTFLKCTTYMESENVFYIKIYYQ